MPEFLKLIPPQEALAKLLENLPQPVIVRTEWVESQRALGRVTAQAVNAPEESPAFSRSTVDGYAVRARDTFGASESLPAYLALRGEVAMGQAAQISVNGGEAVLIHTGGMLPQGADAVVMLEYCQQVRPGEIEVLRPVANGENIILAGEDVHRGEEVLPAGRRLRPAELGGLMALGITRVGVVARPCVGILSSGDEVIPPVETPAPGQVRDINSTTLAALVEQAGGIARSYGILPDSFDALFSALQTALVECDLVVVTAGSSASARDLTAAAISKLGKPGVLVHGVSVRPGKPAILGVCAGKAVVGLPGNPVSALVIAGLFVTPLIERLLGLASSRAFTRLQACLTAPVASQAGRDDFVPVRLSENEHGWLAEPIYFKSNMIFSLARADGLGHIPADANGVAAGDWIEVIRF